MTTTDAVERLVIPVVRGWMQETAANGQSD